MKEEILDLLKEINNQEEIEIADIPIIDLYMDQVITLFERRLDKGKRNKEDKLLTKTMINNYVKDKILMPTKNKKYSPEHLILLIITYNLKQILSMKDIKTLFMETIYKEEIDLFILYERFLDVKKQDQIQIERSVSEKIDSLNLDQSNQMDIMMMVLSLINSANVQKRLAEELIDSYLLEGEKNEK